MKPYLMDLESVNGTFINKQHIEARRYYELLEKVPSHLSLGLHSSDDRDQDTIRLGMSSREYVVLHEGSST